MTGLWSLHLHLQVRRLLLLPLLLVVCLSLSPCSLVGW